MFLPATVMTLLNALDAGLIVSEKFAELLAVMGGENRDLTDEELTDLDLVRDATHDDVQAAIARKRARDQG